MRAALGNLGVIAAFIAALFGSTGIAVGTIRNRPRLTALAYRYVPLVLVGAVVAVAAMEWALLSRDYSLKYVAENNARDTPVLYTIAGLWAALEGSILLWGLILAIYVAIAYRHFRHRRNDPLVAWATVVMLAVCVFFFAVMLGPANPFRTMLLTPADGRGPNPLLQNHPLMAVHPPLLYLGFVGFTIPFSFAIAALITGRVGEGWLLETRRWTLIAWGALTLGIAMGAWWAYEVLGWGGYWGWDAVENTSLLPWLTGTAYIHSVLVQERRGMLRVWNISLLCATFSLTILGTFLTRSGVIESVHAFSNSEIGAWFLGLFAAIVVLSLVLIAWRGDELRSVGAIDSPVSREGAFLANNLVFAAFAFVVLLGTVFPLIVEAWNDERLAIGAPYFDTMTMPLGMALLFLMAVAPVLPWRKASTEVLSTRLQWPMAFGVAVVVGCVAFGLRGVEPLLAFFLGAFAAGSALRQLVLAARAARSRGKTVVHGLVGRANGGMIVHLGVILIAVAIAASGSYRESTELTLRPGEKASFEGHTIEFVGERSVSAVDSDGTTYVRKLYADIRVDGRVDSPALTQYNQRGMRIGTPSVRTGFGRDLYFTLIRPAAAESEATTIGFLVQPLTLWLWIGTGVMAVGTLLSVVPGRRRRRPTDPASVHDATGLVNTQATVPSPADIGEASEDIDGDADDDDLDGDLEPTVTREPVG